MSDSHPRKHLGFALDTEDRLLHLSAGIGFLLGASIIPVVWESHKLEAWLGSSSLQFVLAMMIAIIVGVFVYFALRMWLLPALFTALYRMFYPILVASQFAKVPLSERNDPGVPDPLAHCGVVLRQVVQKDYHRHLAPALPAIARLLKESGPEQALPGEWGRTLQAFLARWEAPTPFAPETSTSHEVRFTDPIHGTIEFDASFQWLIRHPLIQRLNEVRQLAFAFPAFPGATHTRFSHSVGVAHLAGTAMRRMVERGVVYTAKGTRHLTADEVSRSHGLINLAVAAGLVHDAAHIPLGHALDRFFGATFFEGERTADKKLLPERIQSQFEFPLAQIEGVSADAVIRILRGEVSGWELFISQLIDSELDVDRIDYLVRDAHFTGRREGLLNIEALLSAMRPFEGEDGNIHLCFSEAYIAEVEQFLYARDVMYLRCYEHPAKVVAEWISMHLVNELFERVPLLKEHVSEFCLLTDHQLMEYVSFCDPERGAALARIFRSGSSEFQEMLSVPFDKSSLEGRLAALFGLYTGNQPAFFPVLKGIEHDIARAAAISPSQVVLVCPLPNSGDERSGQNLFILQHSAGGFRHAPLLPDDDEVEPYLSDVLRRSKYVEIRKVMSLRSMDEVRDLQKTAQGESFSLINALRKARSKLRLYVHVDAFTKKDAILAAFRATGIRTAVPHP